MDPLGWAILHEKYINCINNNGWERNRRCSANYTYLCYIFYINLYGKNTMKYD